MFHHDSKELHDDLGGRADQYLTFATLLSVADGVQRVVQNTYEHHSKYKSKSHT